MTFSMGDALGPMTGYLGAGVYEELLFRLLLLPLLAWVLRQTKLSPAAAMSVAVLLSSLLFAAAHHVGPYGEPFTSVGSFYPKFFFRTLAGIFFGLLFVYRGFGIAAGTHAGYDLLVGLSDLCGGALAGDVTLWRKPPDNAAHCNSLGAKPRAVA